MCECVCVQTGSTKVPILMTIPRNQILASKFSTETNQNSLGKWLILELWQEKHKTAWNFLQCPKGRKCWKNNGNITNEPKVRLNGPLTGQSENILNIQVNDNYNPLNIKKTEKKLHKHIYVYHFMKNRIFMQFQTISFPIS